MAQLEVTVIDQSGKDIKVALPDDRPISQVAEALARKMNYPEARGGQELRLTHKSSGNELNSERTLSQEGVRNGDVLRLRLEAIPGCDVPNKE